jgi:hypothetical protein
MDGSVLGRKKEKTSGVSVYVMGGDCYQNYPACFFFFIKVGLGGCSVAALFCCCFFRLSPFLSFLGGVQFL